MGAQGREIFRNHNPKAVSVQKAPMDFPLPSPHPGPWRENFQTPHFAMEESTKERGENEFL